VKGDVNFAALNQPREVYDAPPPVDISGFADNPLGFLLQNASLLSGGPLEGDDYCQNHGLTPLGEFLMLEMMKRGMIIEVDHFPRKSYRRAYELLADNDYPAVGTHGRNNNGKLYGLGGMSKSNFGRCRSADTSATMDDGFQARIQLKRDGVTDEELEPLFKSAEAYIRVWEKSEERGRALMR